jgi:phasin family protein
MTYAEQNVANSFDLAKKLMVAKSLEDVMRLQTEFAQAQVQALTDQAKDLAEAATKAAAESAKNPFAGTHR